MVSKVSCVTRGKDVLLKGWTTMFHPVWVYLGLELKLRLKLWWSSAALTDVSHLRSPGARGDCGFVLFPPIPRLLWRRCLCT